MAVTPPVGHNVHVVESFAEVFSAAVRQRGLGLDRLVARLDAEGVPVSAATLSYWQTGRSVPTRARSQRSVEALERILEVEPGTLVAHTSRYLRQVEVPWQEQLPSETASQILRELGYPRTSLALHALFTQDTLRLGAQRQEISQTITQLMMVDKHMALGWPIVFVQDSDDDALVTVSESVHCRLGEHVTIPEMRMLVGEMLLPEPARQGARVQTSYSVAWDTTTVESTRCERGVQPGLQAATLQVQYHPDALPTSVRAYRRANFSVPDDQIEDLGPVPVYDGIAQYVVGPIGQGSIGMRWTWD